MKTLYLIGGTMGVGKSTVCQLLKRRLQNSVFLDGDWCWDAHPFQVTEETKEMVVQNICFLLGQFLRCTAYDNVIFCWVMHEQEIIDSILKCVSRTDCQIRPISLVCDKETLKKRLKKDVERGVRSEDAVRNSLERLPLYEVLDTEKIDTTGKTVLEIAEEILFSTAGCGDVQSAV